MSLSLERFGKAGKHVAGDGFYLETGGLTFDQCSRECDQKASSIAPFLVHKLKRNVLVRGIIVPVQKPQGRSLINTIRLISFF